MKLTFLGATHEVTGSCTLLEACGKRIVIDCGMEQGIDLYENCELPVGPGEIDAALLTHAHIDHSGKLPLLTAGGFRGPIYTTLATARLCNIMLRDSAHIQESEAEWQNRKSKRSGQQTVAPLYTMADAEQTLRQLDAQPYGDWKEIFPGIRVRFEDAGHLLGSASIYVEVTEGDDRVSLLFSGDLGNCIRPLIRDPRPADYADYVVVESTYGDRVHGERPDYVGQLSRILQQTLDRGGNLVIPCFAVGRTQEMLYLIRQIKNEGLVHGHDGFPVYVDSPMAVEATQIYAAKLPGFYDDETLALLEQGIDPITFPELHLSITSEESKQINFDRTPKVILSASGMCEAGRIRHHLKHNLWRPDSTILFVGYQSQGTLGRKIIDGADSIKLFGEQIAVHAHVENLNGISGHADRDMILAWLKAMGKAPRQVFVNHGEDTVCDNFVKTVEEQLNYPATAPFSGDSYDLLTGACIQKGVVTRIAAKSKGRIQANAAYDRLMTAGQRLITVIKKNKNLANKELAKFTDQIIALCNKYDR